MKFLRKCRGCCGPIAQRYVIVIMAATGLGFMFVLRNTFSLILTEMTIKQEAKPQRQNSSDLFCPKDDGNKKKTEDKGEFKWDSTDTQWLISAYFYGYAACQFPGGFLGDLLGAKIVINTGLFVSGICALLSPCSARLHYWVLFVVRIVMGLGHGLVIPALSSLVGKWSPPTERSLMSAITYSGIMFGSAAGIGTSGLILGSLPGWEPAFYIYGGMMVAWCIAFQIVGYSNPQDHPFITDREQTKIEESIAKQSKKKPTKIPFRKMFTSLPVIAFILINFGHSWLVFFVGVQIPIYMKTVLNFDIKASGIVSALPYLGMWLSGICVGIVSDYLIAHEITSVTLNRRVFGILSNFLPVPFLIGASYAGCDKITATALFTCMMLFKGMSYSSLKTNPVDLAPNFAGIIMGIAQTFSAVGGLIIPYVVTLFVKKEEASINDWRKTFMFSAAILILVTVPYAFWGTGVQQSWNDVQDGEEDN
uniref:Major facilitator superfamily (MFS) profile domain-containing protein n=1 Tax=Clastoptera arizonana TaxID=38151 RepID=A0A1B6CNH3_9HEMI